MSKKAIAAGVLLCAFSMTSAHAQSSTGTIILPCGNTPALTRLTPPSANGVCGFRFGVDVLTRGNTFSLTSSPASASLDIWFYAVDSSCLTGIVAGCPLGFWSPTAGSITNVVPATAVYAIVVLEVNRTTPATAAASHHVGFTYTA